VYGALGTLGALEGPCPCDGDGDGDARSACDENDGGVAAWA
jgi:hypothetical protein